MINMAQMSQNNIIDIIDNIMERVRLNRYLDPFLNRMEVLRTYLEDLIRDYNFKQESLVSSILEISQEEMEGMLKIPKLIIINNNKYTKEVGLAVLRLHSI